MQAISGASGPRSIDGAKSSGPKSGEGAGGTERRNQWRHDDFGLRRGMSEGGHDVLVPSPGPRLLERAPAGTRAPMRPSAYATASPATSNSPRSNDVGGPNGIRTRVWSRSHFCQ